MTRPTDWWVLDLGGDPTPGDPHAVRSLARQLADIAQESDDAQRAISRLRADQGLEQFVGQAAVAFLAKLGKLPGQLTKLSISYHAAATALTTYAPKLERAQGDADAALARGRTARRARDGARQSLSSAQSRERGAAAGVSRASSALPPDPAAVRAAVDQHSAAVAGVRASQSRLDDAERDLEQARRLAQQAKELRESAGRTAAHAVDQASDAGIQNESFWHKVTSVVASTWKDLVTICKIVVAVLGIVALILGGPIAWIVVAAAAVVLADTIAKYAQGKATLLDVALAALMCIPMTKGLTSLKSIGEGLTALKAMSGAERGAAALAKLTAAGEGLRGMVTMAPAALVNLATSAPVRLERMAATLAHADPVLAFNSGVAAFTDARAAGKGLFTALGEADTARYVAFRQGGIDAIAGRNAGDVVATARHAQAGGGYEGVDAWSATQTSSGQVYSTGTPYVGNYAAVGDHVAGAGKDAQVYNELVQVGRGGPGEYRPAITSFTAPGGLDVAQAPLRGNPQFSPGTHPGLPTGGVQTFFPHGLPTDLATAPVGTTVNGFTVTGRHTFDPSTLRPLDIPTNADYASTWSHYQSPVKIVRGLVGATGPQR